MSSLGPSPTMISIARQAAGLVNQGRGSRPAGIVEHGLVQRCQDALEGVLLAHNSFFTSGLNLRRARRLISRTLFSTVLCSSRFFLIFVPFRLYDEPKILPWQFHLPVQLVPTGKQAGPLTSLYCSLYIRLIFAIMRLVRKPLQPERLYVDFDGFFAACEEQADPRLQGRPIGVIPFADAVHSCVIAANALAKRSGIRTGTSIAEARRLCPGVALVAQQPDLYVRVQQRIVAAVLDVLPIDAVCSIDELVASIEDRDSPVAIAQQVKRRVRDAVGDRITCSIGCAPNRWLAKVAADLDKPNGLTVLSPSELPGRLLDLDIEELPGVGKRMSVRLKQAGLASIEELWQAEPGWLRSVWGSVARRSSVVRAAWLRRGSALDPPQLDRSRSRPASGGAPHRSCPATGQAVDGEGSTARAEVRARCPPSLAGG